MSLNEAGAKVRLLLAPAGGGKTFRCLGEIRNALAKSADGPPLLLIAPKQTTYQLERQLLADPSLPGYTRLQILSFERLAAFVFEQLEKPPPRLLDEEGRLMVLRGLLARRHAELELFHATARLTGFAQHLSAVLAELQRQRATPESLRELAGKVRETPGLASKLRDFAILLGDYLEWLTARQLQDADQLLDFATQSLRAAPARFALAGLWVDGFTELAPRELDLLAEIIQHTPRATITLCLDHVPREKVSWLSNWSMARRAYEHCRARLGELPHCDVATELLRRETSRSRFRDSPVLGYLENYWTEPAPWENLSPRQLDDALAFTICPDATAEATLAAREILQFVRAGGRYREVTVLARNLDDYHSPLVNVFTRYGIPFFLDRRESVSHHPLVELTRNALRTVANSWRSDDWFAALKTGLVPASESEIDRLENEALERGWKGAAWQEPIVVPGEPELSAQLEEIRRRVIKPFNNLALRLAEQGNHPTGPQLADALRKFWEELRVSAILEKWSDGEPVKNPIHATVWERMDVWLENLGRAFPAESPALREWLPILDAGLGSLTVGVIPPALDQVFIGAVDRSRNPDIRLALVLGVNETVFPAPPESPVLLTDVDREELERRGLALATPRQRLSQERFFGYIAFTRARERLVVSCREVDGAGTALNPSPFLTHLKQIFPGLEPRRYSAPDWRDYTHPTELIVPLLQGGARGGGALAGLYDLPPLTQLRERLEHLIQLPDTAALSPILATRLYGDDLRTSVSRLEQFAACPFRFFVHSGLRAEERKRFEIDVRDQGNFQHNVLAEFHEQLKSESKRWRDISPENARERIKALAAIQAVKFRDGLMQSSDEALFTARMLEESLCDFVSTVIGWMREGNQYAFDPVAAELPFDDRDNAFPPWVVGLGGHRLLLQGRIDRVDLWREAGADEALCVVVDYKSSLKRLDPVMMAHGLQLQLPAYLSVLRHWENPRPVFDAARLVPAGVFYVNLRGNYDRARDRDEMAAGAANARRRAYRHSGRFDSEILGKLDQRPNATEGDQFNYRKTKDGKLHGNSRDAMAPEKFKAMLDAVETTLKTMGQSIYAGVTAVDPYRKGVKTACDTCDYHAICRIDPWTHNYRMLGRPAADSDEE